MRFAAELTPCRLRKLPQNKGCFLALRVSVAGGRDANSFDNEAAFPEYPERGLIAGSGGEQRAFCDFS